MLLARTFNPPPCLSPQPSLTDLAFQLLPQLVEKGEEGLLRRLLELGMTLDTVEASSGETLLLRAAKLGQKVIFEMLIKAGASLARTNVRDCLVRGLGGRGQNVAARLEPMRVSMKAGLRPFLECRSLPALLPCRLLSPFPDPSGRPSD